MGMELDSDSRVADGAVTVGGDLSVVADEANREFDVFYERGLFASVGNVGVLAGPFDVRLDYRAFRGFYHVVNDLYLRKACFLFVALNWWIVIFLFHLNSLEYESFGGRLSIFAFFAAFVLMAWWLVLPPSPPLNRDAIAREYFVKHGVDMEAWNPGPVKWFGDPADCSVSVRVQVRVTELGVEELTGDGSLIRIPFTKMRRWPSMMHGLMTFVTANKDRDSLKLSHGRMAYLDRIGNYDGLSIPLSSLDRPWVLWRECYGRIRQARKRERRSRRWKRLSRVVLFPKGVRDRWSDRSDALVAQDSCWELAADVFNLVRLHRDGDVSFLDELSGGQLPSDSFGGVLRDLILETGGNDGDGDGDGAGAGANGVNGAAGVASVAGVAGAVGAAAPAAAGSGTVFPNSVSWR